MSDQNFVRLHPDFLIEMRRSRIEAVPRKIENWLRDNKAGFKRGQIAKLLQGEPQRELCVAKLVKYLLKNEHQGADREDYKLVARYLAQRGKGELLDQSIHTIARELSEVDLNDGMLHATKRLISGDYFTDLLTPDTRRCSPEELRKSFEWMYLDFARQIHPDREDWTLAQAQRVFEQTHNVTCADYFAAAERWQRFDGWTCIQAIYKKQRLGMSLMLPLKEHVYHEFREGKRAMCDFHAQDLERPSRYLMFQVLTHNPSVRGMPLERVQKSLIKHVVHQVARLSYSDTAAMRKPLRIIAFAPTPLMEIRLKEDNFRALKSTMPGQGLPLYERSFDKVSYLKNHHDFFVNAAITTIGMLTQDRFSPPDWPEQDDYPSDSD